MIDPIEQAKQWTREGKSRFLNTFAFVPDDKLTWTPSPTAHSALRIAAHVGVCNQTLVGALTGEAAPSNDRAELLAMGEAAEKAITTREAAIQLIEESTETVLAALDQVKPDQIDKMVETPFLKAPMSFFLTLFGSHMGQHAAQIDYLQTIWGDHELHF
ncbi:MAG TPA: DinB family protein [Armatimonadetes bacterium]|jgi:hypothetical protein|nr:DinB family protein [Armatimonadota bacterium]